MLEKCKGKVFLTQYDGDGDLIGRSTGWMRCFRLLSLTERLFMHSFFTELFCLILFSDSKNQI